MIYNINDMRIQQLTAHVIQYVCVQRDVTRRGTNGGNVTA